MVLGGLKFRLETLLTFRRLAVVAFPYDWVPPLIGFLKELFKANLSFEFSRSLRDLEFRCGFYYFNDNS